MKRITVFMMAIGLAFSFVAQERWESHFMAGASAGFTVGSKSNDKLSHREYADYWGTSITGGYKWFVHKGLFILPELSFYYENHDAAGIDGVGASAVDGSMHASETGFALDAMVGYSIPCSKNNSIDFMTGPYFACAFDQHDTTKITRIDGTTESFHITDLANTTSFRWRFALGVNVWRMTVKAAYDVSVTDLKTGYDGREHHVLSLGVAYNF